MKNKLNQIKTNLEDIVKTELNKEAEKEVEFLKYNQQLCKKDRKKFFQTTWKNYSEKIKDLLYYFVYGNNINEQNETINKIYQKYKKEAKTIIDKINKTLEGITDINLVYNDKYLKVYEIKTDNGKNYFKFEKIIAGGYNKQKRHIRFTIKVQKTLPKNVIIENSYIDCV